MTITYEGAGAQVNGPGGTVELNVPYPAGILADDLLVLMHGWNTITASDTPAGWTSQEWGNSGGFPSLEIFTKVAVGDESGTLNIHQAGGAGNAIMFLFRGVDPVTPMDAPATFGAHSDQVPPTVIPGLTTTMVGVCLAVFVNHNVMSDGDTPPDSPAQFTEIHDTVVSPRGSASYLVWDSSGATGDVTVTSAVNARGPGIMIAMRPLVGSQAYEATGTVEVISDTSGTFSRNLAMGGTVSAISNTTGIIDGTDTGASEGSKADMLMAELIGQGYTEGTINDRLYRREKEAYEAGPQTYYEGDGPFSLADYMIANGTDLSIL